MPYRSTPIPAAKTVWKKVVDQTAEVTGFDVHAAEIYLLSHKNASRFKVLRTSLSCADLAHAAVAVPASEVVINNIGAAADALCCHRISTAARLFASPAVQWRQHSARKPAILRRDSIAFVTSPRESGAWLELTSWTKSPLRYSLDAKTDKLTDTALVPPSPVDFSQIESEEVKAKSADSTMIPLSIIHKRGLALDGSHPTWLTGYGAFYGINYDPYFDPTMLVFLEHGGVRAFCSMRGGGEYGEDWHQAGQKAGPSSTP